MKARIENLSSTRVSNHIIPRSELIICQGCAPKRRGSRIAWILDGFSMAARAGGMLRNSSDGMRVKLTSGAGCCGVLCYDTSPWHRAQQMPVFFGQYHRKSSRGKNTPVEKIECSPLYVGISPLPRKNRLTSSFCISRFLLRGSGVRPISLIY